MAKTKKKYRWNKRVFLENLTAFLVMSAAGVGLGYVFFMWACEGM